MFDWVSNHKEQFLISYTQIGNDHATAAELQNQHGQFSMNAMVSMLPWHGQDTSNAMVSACYGDNQTAECNLFNVPISALLNLVQ